VANPLLPVARFDTPLTYEDMRAAGSGLGAAGFIVFDDRTDFAAVAAGVARFLAVESCGQCTPCKHDGLAIAALLEVLCRSEASEHDLDELHDRIGTVADSARCYLAIQHEAVLASILRLFPDAFDAHMTGRARPVEPMLIAPIVELQSNTATIDAHQASKQPDWTYGTDWSGKTPVERLAAGGTDA
jgi:NADH:ubiquinone oxidoreductase subunit F (NADH-binding)